MALPIRQRLSALTCLKAGPKAVLIEVCELHANGGRGCYASNGHLAKKLGTSERSITRAVAGLESAGYVSSSGLGKARALAPSDAVVAAYQPGAAGEAAATNLDKNGDQPSQIGEVGEVGNLDKNGSEPSQKWYLNLDKNGSEPSQKASRVYGDDQNDQYNDQDDQPAALAMAEKKIEQLSDELAEALESLRLSRATIAELRADLETEKRKGRATHVATPVASAAQVSPEFTAIWKDFRVAQGIAANSARERVLLAALAELAANEDEAIAIVTKSVRKGWNDLYKLDEPRPQHSAQNGVAGHGFRPAPAVHANAFGIARPQSLAIAGALAVGSDGHYPDLI